jgi:hypothetical protein
LLNITLVKLTVEVIVQFAVRIFFDSESCQTAARNGWSEKFENASLQ